MVWDVVRHESVVFYADTFDPAGRYIGTFSFSTVAFLNCGGQRRVEMNGVSVDLSNSSAPADISGSKSLTNAFCVTTDCGNPFLG